MNIETLFPTLIGIEQADQETIAAIAREVLAQRPALEGLLSQTWGDNVLSSFDSEKDLFTFAGLQTLKDFVEKSILEFVQATRVDQKLQFDPKSNHILFYLLDNQAAKHLLKVCH